MSALSWDEVDCNFILFTQFNKFLPYLEKIKDKTIKEYLQELREETSSDNIVESQPCSTMVLPTHIWTGDAHIQVTIDTDYRELEISLNNKAGMIFLKEQDETKEQVGINTLEIVYEPAGRSISERQWLDGYVSSSVCTLNPKRHLFKVIGNTIHFRDFDRSRVNLTPLEASTSPGSTRSPKQITNGLHSAQALLPAPTEGGVYPQGSIASQQITNGLHSAQALLPAPTEGGVYPQGSSGDCL